MFENYVHICSPHLTFTLVQQKHYQCYQLLILDSMLAVWHGYISTMNHKSQYKCCEVNELLRCPVEHLPCVLCTGTLNVGCALFGINMMTSYCNHWAYHKQFPNKTQALQATGSSLPSVKHSNVNIFIALSIKMYDSQSLLQLSKRS